MSAKAIRCDRCRRRLRNPAGWNSEFIAGLAVGAICPGCQSPGEDLEAELNLITGASDGVPFHRPGPDAHPLVVQAALLQVVSGLVRAYPTPEVLRFKATQLAERRRDRSATDMATLMRNVADDMESGQLWVNVND